MLMAGHSGLPIYMNNLTGEWSTSSYYTEQMPKWLEQYNSEKPIDGYMERTWENLYPAAYYKAAAAVGGTGFSYGVKATCNGLRMYDNFTTIPYCNDYICDLALKAADKEKMGNDLTTDLLMVNFSLSRFFMKEGASVSIEEEDAYLRLDKTLKRLIETLENKVGKVVNKEANKVGKVENKAVNKVESKVESKAPVTLHGRMKSVLLLARTGSLQERTMV